MKRNFSPIIGVDRCESETILYSRHLMRIDLSGNLDIVKLKVLKIGKNEKH